MTGQSAYLAGLSAEAQVCRHYQEHGYKIRAQRWRGRAGEIDLVFSKDQDVIFVEVKKSRSVETALTRVGRAQRARILQTGDEYLGQFPSGLATPCRYDIAAVDQVGRIHIVENAFLE